MTRAAAVAARQRLGAERPEVADMYLFDPTPLQVVMAAVGAVAAAFVAAWAVTGGEGAAGGGESPDAAGGSPEPRELETRQKVILWTAAGAVLLFLLWWASLSAGTGGPSLL